MKKTLLLILTTFATSAFSNSVDYKKEDIVWVNAAIGNAKITSSNKSNLTSEGLSIKANIGYDFTENFAVYGGGGTFRNIADKNINYLNAGFKVSYPFLDNWIAYSTIGGTSVINNDVSGKVQVNMGVGISYQITPKFSTQIGYDFYNKVGVIENINEDLGQITWGISYFFDRPDTSNKTIQQIKIFK